MSTKRMTLVFVSSPSSSCAVYKPKHTDPDESWHGFERLTRVPIQTRMVLEHMLTN
jgi:hypothetical protein